MPSITTRHGGRRRPLQGQGQSQGQAHATAPMQQQASLSRLESNNLIDSSNMNVNGAALLTGLGEPYESLMQSCGPLSVTCIVMWSLISHLHRHTGPCQSVSQALSFVQSSGVVSVACTVLGCSVSHMLGHVVPYQAHPQSCGALSVICTLLPPVLNPAFLLAGLFANQGRESIIDLILPLPSAVAFRL